MDSFYKRRKAGLGKYSGTREEWVAAYREARVLRSRGERVDPSNSGLLWKAGLVVDHERSMPDPLACSPYATLVARKIIDEIMAEEY